MPNETPNIFSKSIFQKTIHHDHLIDRTPTCNYALTKVCTVLKLCLKLSLDKFRVYFYPLSCKNSWRARLFNCDFFYSVITTRTDSNSADLSTMQDSCHTQTQFKCSPWVLLARWIECLPGVWEVLVRWTCPELRFFSVPNSYHVDLLLFFYL